LWGFADAAYPREGTVTVRVRQKSKYQNDAAYPREGTVTLVPEDIDRSIRDAAYPREGTVTLAVDKNSIREVMQLIPARGRLPVRHLFLGQLCWMQLIPARGRLRG